MKLPVTLLILVQLVGLGVCAVLAWPMTRARETPTFERGPHLSAAAALDDAVAAPETVGIAPAALEAAIAERLDTRIELVAGPYTARRTWRELGLAVVGADDRDGASALARRGYRLRPARLTPADGSAPIDALVGFHLDSARRALAALAERFDRAPLAARWDFANDRVVGSITGRALRIDDALPGLLDAAADPASTRIELPIREDVPSPVSADLVDFRPAELMSAFSTVYNTKNRDRATNLRLAARAIDGLVLMPGQTFSYNETVGERSLERGFMEAPVIVANEIVEGIGGGACQVSSTLYAASLFGGVDIVERQNHSLPSSYIDMGLDAVVAWPLLDLKLRNPYDFPIVLRAYLDEDRMRAEVLGPRAGHRVVVRKEVSDELPFDEVVELDETLEPGAIRTRRQGKLGYKVQRGRILWKGGAEEFERLPTDIYQPRSKQVRIGPDTVYPPEPELALEP